MKRILYCILLVCTPLAVFAGKRAFTIQDYFKVKIVEDPQFSPDGARIAFNVRENHIEQGTTTSQIYVVNADGTGLRQLTSTPARNLHPRWSPDGREILFVSDRKDGEQVWVIPADGGESRQVTAFSSGAGDPIWSGDGKRIVFTSDVFPECGADDSCNKQIDASMSSGPIQAHMADHLLYRHWTAWKDGKRSHVFACDLQGKSITDLSPGDFDAPAFSLGGQGFVCSSDGKEVCFVSNHDPNEAETTNKDLWIVPAGGGNPVNITADNEAYDGDPAYSPDGRYIAYRTQKVPRYESDRFRLALYNRSTHERTILTEAFDNWVENFEWSPDSRSIVFTADVKGHVPLYRVDIRTNKISELADLKTIDALTISPKGNLIVVARRSIGEPFELYRLSENGGNAKALTSFNKALADSVDMRPADVLWIPSPTGAMIQTFVVKPHNFDPSKKYPLILNVHGGPQDQWADAFRGDWQMYPGYVVAFPNPHGSTGEGQAFTAAISKDWGGEVYRDVMAVTDSLARIPWVDSARMGAMGWSFGGYMMMWLEGHTTRFKAIASMMGVYDLTSMYGATEELWFPQWDLGGKPWDSPLYQKWSPSNFAQNFKTPCLVITGEQDFRVPYTQSLEFFTDLQQMGVPSRLIVFKNDGHWPNSVKSMPLYYNAHLDWFHRYLGGGPAPYDMTKMLRNQIFR